MSQFENKAIEFGRMFSQIWNPWRPTLVIIRASNTLGVNTS